MQPPRLILASASPRRRQLLEAAGYRFEVMPADVDESSYPASATPAEIAALLADRKADAVAMIHRHRVTLASDTVIALDGTLFGKPVDRADAERILSLLSGSSHEVITGVTVVAPSAGLRLSRVERSVVVMRELTDRELADYLAGGQWQGKAGAYGIQDPDPFVTRIEGSLTNIVGLPMEVTAELLSLAGIEPENGAAQSR